MTMIRLIAATLAACLWLPPAEAAEPYKLTIKDVRSHRGDVRVTIEIRNRTAEKVNAFQTMCAYIGKGGVPIYTSLTVLPGAPAYGISRSETKVDDLSGVKDVQCWFKAL